MGYTLVLRDIQPTGDTWASMMGLSWESTTGITEFFPNVWGWKTTMLISPQKKNLKTASPLHHEFHWFMGYIQSSVDISFKNHSAILVINPSFVELKPYLPSRYTHKSRKTSSGTPETVCITLHHIASPFGRRDSSIAPRHADIRKPVGLVSLKHTFRAPKKPELRCEFIILVDGVRRFFWGALMMMAVDFRDHFSEGEPLFFELSLFRLWLS